MAGMTSPGDLLAYRVSQLEKLVQDQAAELAAIEERNAQRDRERAAQEQKQLLYGISFLGGIILTLFGVIWNFRGVIFRGQP